MPDKQPTILAIDPATYRLGFAVFAGGELVSFGVSRITGRSKPAQAGRILSRLIAEYEPTTLALETPYHTQRRVPGFAAVFEQLKTVARVAGLVVVEYPPNVVRARLCQDRKPTKQAVTALLSDKYPQELEQLASVHRYWERHYREPIFGAVALGAVCLQTARDH